MQIPVGVSSTMRAIAVCLLILGVVAGCTYVELDSTDEYYDAPLPEPPAHYTSGEFGELTEYGAWIHTAPFGWVWQPYAEEDWQPYYHGHWIWSQWGWTWVSYEPFGWAVYHYGNWVFDPIWGWIWAPAYDWSPARVQWIVYDDYICWAPLPPSGHLIGDPWASPIDDIWVVVQPDYFTHTHVGRYAKRRYRWKTTSSSISQVIRNAPDVRYVGRHTRKTISKIDVKITKTKVGSREIRRMHLPPGQRKTVERYRSEVRKKVEGGKDYRLKTRKKVETRERRGKSTKAKSRSEVKTETRSRIKKESKSKSRTKVESKSKSREKKDKKKAEDKKSRSNKKKKKKKDR